jgi:peptidoglycan hydrolase-like protein with peptidoglycan-binding domain
MTEQPDLVPGHTGEWVTYLQQLLTYHQAGDGFEDARYCAATESAVRELQRCHSLPETGRCDASVWERLTAESDDMVIAFSTEDQVEAPAEQLELTDVDGLPGEVAVS